MYSKERTLAVVCGCRRYVVMAVLVKRANVGKPWGDVVLVRK